MTQSVVYILEAVKVEEEEVYTASIFQVIHYSCAVIHQFGNRIREVVMETLKKFEVDDVKITVVDKGALDCTIKARVEGALSRSTDQFENILWGGARRR